MAENSDTQRHQRRRGQHCRKSSQSEPRHTQPSNHTVQQSKIQKYLSVPENVSPAVVQDDYPIEQMEYTYDMGGSEGIGAGTSDLGSYHDGTDCAVTDDTNSSWLVVQQHQHQRSYSNESNRTGDVSDGPYLSTPSEGKPEWTYGAAFAVDREVEHGPIMCQNHPLLLSDLSSPEPKPPSDSLRPVLNITEEYQESTDHYSIQYSDTSMTIELPVRSSRIYDGTEASWNHLEHRVPRYDPAFAIFAPLSPSESLIGRPSSLPEDSKSKSSERKTPEKKPRSTRATKPAKVKGKGKATPGTLGWEHTVVRKGGLERVFEHTQEEPIQRSGVRKGKLHPETKEKARRVRKVGACWGCWVLKVPCSEGEVCDRCRKQVSKCSPAAGQLCSRAGFVDYDEAFFGQNLEFLHSHLDRNQIKALISEHASYFTDTSVEVEVMTGQCFDPMRLQANFFKPKGPELLQLHHVTAEAEFPSSQLVCRYSAPIGMMAFSTSEMKELCRGHVEKMIETPEYAIESTSGDPTQIPYLILEVILKYCADADIPLLRNALMLHACHHFMGRLVTFSEKTADEVYRIVNPYGPSRENYLSSRLLNRQIKYAMHKLHREIMKDVLEGLEKSMRSRTKSSWGPSFCAILLLCLCIERLQVAADIFIVCDIQKSENEGTTSQYNRDQSFAACQNLEDYPFHQSTRLFHDIYRSHRESNGGAREGFNPLRSFGNDGETGLDEPANTMVKHIHWAITDSYAEMQELSQKPTLVDNGFRAEPSDIKANNTARLVSKFLMSFFPS